jgi:hypothetical protein
MHAVPQYMIFHILVRKNDFWSIYAGRLSSCLLVGHARNYVSTDIIRRILRDFFDFNVKFVMNIVRPLCDLVKLHSYLARHHLS